MIFTIHFGDSPIFGNHPNSLVINWNCDGSDDSQLGPGFVVRIDQVDTLLQQRIRAVSPPWELRHNPWKINSRNLQIIHFERNMIFQTSMIMFHVNLQGWNPYQLALLSRWFVSFPLCWWDFGPSVSSEGPYRKFYQIRLYFEKVNTNFPTWNAKCPIFLGNFTPRTSNYCVKNRAFLGFPGRIGYVMICIPILFGIVYPIDLHNGQ